VSAKKKSAKPAVKKPTGFKYKPRFGLVVEVGSEKEQSAAYEKLKGMGYPVRVVTV